MAASTTAFASGSSTTPARVGPTDLDWAVAIEDAGIARSRARAETSRIMTNLTLLKDDEKMTWTIAVQGIDRVPMGSIRYWLTGGTAKLSI
jgi:hypothetical protein